METPSRGEVPDRKALVVCGPTAAGKSALSDSLASALSDAWGGWVETLVVDSVQAYREIPKTTNQRRERPAELVGIVSVEDEWTVALHKERAERKILALDEGAPFVLDAGTGMYLNAIVLDIPLAPKVPGRARREAQEATANADNPRRAAREEELKLAGAPERGSVWAGRPRYDAAFLYLRPPRDSLDERIAERSRRIVRDGAEEEGETLLALDPNPSVRAAVGPKEAMELASGAISAEEAREKIAARTRRLARRQMRWFDKLVRTLPPQTGRIVIEDPDDPRIRHWMHDIMCSWA